MAAKVIQKNTSNRYSKAHAARNKKTLAGKLDWLSPEYVRNVNAHCQHRLPDPNAVVAMTALLTGWSISDLLKSDTKVVSDSTGAFHLVSPWNFPDPELGSPLGKHLYSSEDTGLIPLPLELGIMLQGIVMHDDKQGVTKKSIRRFLSEISTEQDLQITTRRVSNTLHYYGSWAGLNALERRFISGQVIRDASQNYYVCFDMASTFEKLYRFWDWSLDKTTWHYPMPPVKLFGSKRALTKSGIKAIFEWYEKNILEKLFLNENQEAFNLYTLYVIDLLQLVTLCRPVDAIFGSLSNFDYSFEFVFIHDKGESSQRILPLPQSVRPVLKHYVKHLNALRELSSFTYRHTHEAIGSIIDGVGPLFHFSEQNKIHPVTNSGIKKRLTHFDIHRNWHRHSVITALLEEGECAEKVACFADHQPPFEHYFSRYSSFEYKSIIEISRRIESLVHRWKLPLLEPPFNWRVER